MKNTEFLRRQFITGFWFSGACIFLYMLGATFFFSREDYINGIIYSTGLGVFVFFFVRSLTRIAELKMEEEIYEHRKAYEDRKRKI